MAARSPNRSPSQLLAWTVMFHIFRTSMSFDSAYGGHVTKKGRAERCAPRACRSSCGARGGSRGLASGEVASHQSLNPPHSSSPSSHSSLPSHSSSPGITGSIAISQGLEDIGASIGDSAGDSIGVLLPEGDERKVKTLSLLPVSPLLSPPRLLSPSPISPEDGPYRVS